MSQKILQINFNFNVTAEEYEKTVSPLAQQFADVPGCQWKIWLMNESRNEAGGIYLFEDEEAFENFRQSELAAMVKSHPALSNFSMKDFTILDEVSKVTRAPLAQVQEPA